MTSYLEPRLLTDIGAILGQHREAVDRAMEAAVNRFVDDRSMRDALSYHLGWLNANFEPETDRAAAGGKRVRPALALLCFQSALVGVGGMAYTRATQEDAFTLAAALELFHNYSLIHDDIEDQDRLRRGRETLWTLIGEAKAINAGDCLHALSFATLSQLAERGLDLAALSHLLAVMTRCSVQLTLGQNADLGFEDELLISTERYIKMITGKTAALLSTSAYTGALLALGTVKENRARLEAYGQLGYQLGLAFQIWDDGLGIWGVTGKTGKLSGSDIRRRKKSLPILYALENVTGETRDALVRLYTHTTVPVTPEQEFFVKCVLDDVGAKGYVHAQAEKYKQGALAILDELAAASGYAQENPYLEMLRAVVLYMTERAH